MDQEKLCVDKYTRYAQCAKDKQLGELFSRIAGIEQQHYDTLVKIEGGSVPTMSGSTQSTSPAFTASYGMGDTPDKQSDCYLCTDTLASEKHVSSLYDTCIFEFKDTAVRDALNHIQKEEQHHGKMLYDYMQANSMY